MKRKSRAGANELLKDFYMINDMTKKLGEHQKKIRAIAKHVARSGYKTGLTEGVVENLDLVMSHMNKARKELERAGRRLKMV
ncbi:MAG: hypothetical protein KGH72_00525 [Candidatus Micrarchaeota archaeon]|nr:hypothetical protein [Candidatus Micrarchaeota archaeon]